MQEPMKKTEEYLERLKKEIEYSRRVKKTKFQYEEYLAELE
jgi:hypothetical protein